MLCWPGLSHRPNLDTHEPGKYKLYSEGLSVPLKIEDSRLWEKGQMVIGNNWQCLSQCNIYYFMFYNPISVPH